MEERETMEDHGPDEKDGEESMDEESIAIA